MEKQVTKNFSWNQSRWESRNLWLILLPARIQGTSPQYQQCCLDLLLLIWYYLSAQPIIFKQWGLIWPTMTIVCVMSQKIGIYAYIYRSWFWELKPSQTSRPMCWITSGFWYHWHKINCLLILIWCIFILIIAIFNITKIINITIFISTTIIISIISMLSDFVLRGSLTLAPSPLLHLH